MAKYSRLNDMTRWLVAGGMVVSSAGLASYLVLRRWQPHLLRLAQTTWSVWCAGRSDTKTLQMIQHRRFVELLGFAREHSSYYRDHYRGFPTALSSVDLADIPIVTKPDLMAHFDDWMTDPCITRSGVDAFLADPTTIGERYLGRFAVWTTAGTTGKPGIFVHDSASLAAYNIIGLLRAPSVMHLITWRQLRALLRHGSRNALLAVTGGHFVGASETEHLRRHAPRWLANSGRIFSVLQPLPDLVRALNDFQPNRIGGYPTALAVLAQEQLAGRLHIHPTMLTPAGESLSTPTRQRLERIFRCPVRMGYAASEFIALAFECPAGWLHVNADWVILEPVDADYRPVPPGTRSHTVLLTNLANYVAPLIRYDLGDSIIVKPGSCLCGCRLPAIHVEGREADVLHLEAADGSKVDVLPLAIGTVMEETRGVRRCQIIQTGPGELTLRLEVASGADETATWVAVTDRLEDFLRMQGVTSVAYIRDSQPPQPDPVSGKFRQVWSVIPSIAGRQGAL